MELEAWRADVEYFRRRLSRWLPEGLERLLSHCIAYRDDEARPPGSAATAIKLYPAFAVDAFNEIAAGGREGWVHLGWVVDRLEASWTAVRAEADGVAPPAGARNAFWLAAAGYAGAAPAAWPERPDRRRNGPAIRFVASRMALGPESVEVAIEAFIWWHVRVGAAANDATRVFADLAPLVPPDDPEATARVLARFSELDDRARERLACHALRAWRLDPARCGDEIWAAFATIRGSSMAEVETEVAETEAYLARRAGMPGPLGL
jgi:hypothetical protein